MKKGTITTSKPYNGTIKIYKSDQLIGYISNGEIRGEWWCEPIDKPALLIKGKKQAVSYLITGQTNSI